MTTSTIDPSGFNIEVKVGIDGKDIPLWVRQDDSGPQFDPGIGENGDGGGQPLRDLPIVESVGLELNMGLSGKVTIQLWAPYELGVRIINSPLLRIGNILKVRLGYPNLNRFTPWFHATAQKPDVAIDGEQGLVVTMNGDGGAFAAMRGESALQVTTVAQAIEAMCELHEWTCNLPPQSGTDDPLYIERGNMSQSMAPNWRWLHDMARTAQCDIFLGPPIAEQGQQRREVLYVVRRRDMMRSRAIEGQTRPIYTFVLKGRTDFKRFFPMLAYTSEFENVWLPRAAVRTSTNSINMDDGEEVSAEASGETAAEPAIGGDSQPSAGSVVEDGVKAELAASEDLDGATGEHLYVSPRDPRGQQDMVNAHQFEAQVRGSIQCQITSYAIPELWPSTLVETVGIGHFSGLYAIESMTHTANATEWTMEIRLISTALSREFLREGLSREPSDTSDARVEEPISDDDPTSGAGSIERTAESAT